MQYKKLNYFGVRVIELPCGGTVTLMVWQAENDWEWRGQVNYMGVASSHWNMKEFGTKQALISDFQRIVKPLCS